MNIVDLCGSLLLLTLIYGYIYVFLMDVNVISPTHSMVDYRTTAIELTQVFSFPAFQFPASCFRLSVLAFYVLLN